MSSLRRLSTPVRVSLCVSIGFPVGGVIGAFVVLWLHALTPNYDPSMDLAAAFYALAGLLLGGMAGFTCMMYVPTMPARSQRQIVLMLCGFLAVCCYAHAQRQRYLNAQLFAGIKARNTTAVEIWLNRGADLNARDSTGMTPISLAVQQKDTEMVQYLRSCK